MAVSRVSRKGLTNIPVKVRRALRIEEGDMLLWEVEGEEAARIRVLRNPFKQLAGKYSDPNLTYEKVEGEADRLLERELNAHNRA